MGMGTQAWEWDQNSLRMRQCKLRLKLECVGEIENEISVAWEEDYNNLGMIL